jgi:hypothetical protein
MDIEIKPNIVSEQDAVEILTQMKIDYDKARLQLIDYKLDDLIAEYGKLKELRDEIQEKFFSVIETICDNDLDDIDINAHEWQKIRDSENTNWEGELDIISDYKHQVNECLELLNDGTIEQMLTEDIKT